MKVVPLSSMNITHLCIVLHMRRWCSGIMQDSHSCDPGSIPGRRSLFITKSEVSLDDFVLLKI